jgi:ribosomal protein L13E
MWQKRDWREFSKRAGQSLWQRRRPPRPVAVSGGNRVEPVIGFSLSELDDAGINLAAAEELGLPVDVVRVGTYGPNVSALRDFVRSGRRS